MADWVTVVQSGQEVICVRSPDGWLCGVCTKHNFGHRPIRGDTCPRQTGTKGYKSREGVRPIICGAEIRATPYVAEVAS